MAVERVPPHFAVRDDVEVRPFLEGHGIVDRTVLDPLEIGRTQTAGLQLTPRTQKRLGTQQAADDVASPRAHRGHRERIRYAI